MRFLAKVRVGVRKSFYEEKLNYISDQDQLLELQLLCVLRSQQLGEYEELEKWKTLAFQAISKHSHNANEDNWLRAVYELPILGLTLYQEQPILFLEQCRDVSYALHPIYQYPKLVRHLKLYYRNAVLKVCKKETWRELSEIKKHNNGWAADFFALTLQSRSMESYAIQLSKWENGHVEEQFKNYDSESTAKKIDDLAKIRTEK